MCVGVCIYNMYKRLNGMWMSEQIIIEQTQSLLRNEQITRKVAKKKSKHNDIIA